MTDRSEEQQQSDRRLNEQCFMLANLDVFEGWGRGTTYGTLFKVTGGSPIKFISSLFSRKDLKEVMHIKPSEVAGLVPYIKLYKVYYTSEADPGTSYEMRFENHMLNSSVEAIMQDRKSRGNGVGIKSFEWILAGGNPVEADRMIEAKMVLYFQSMDDLLISHRLDPAPNQRLSESREPREIRYVDLIHQSNKFNVDHCTGDRTYNNKYFRIKATVGWSAPENPTEEQSAAANLMKNSTISVFLTMTKHDISFDDQGGVELTINYMAANEGLMSDPRADVLSVDLEATQQLQTVQQTQESIRRNAAAACPEGQQLNEDARDAQRDVEEAMAERIATIRADRYRAFLSALEEQGAIYYIDVPKEEVDQYQESHFFGLIGGDPMTPIQQARWRLDQMRQNRQSARTWASSGPQRRPADRPAFSELNTAITEASEGDTEDARSTATDGAERSDASGGLLGFLGLGGAANRISNFLTDSFHCTDPSKTRINYLFLGGILQVAIGTVQRENTLGELRNVVGPFEYMDPLNGTKKSICLADVPISLNMFKMWFFEQAVVPQRDKWVLKDFIKNLISSLVVPSMGQDCFGACTSGFRSRVNMRVLEIPLAADGKCRLRPGVPAGQVSIGGLSTQTFSAAGVPGAQGNITQRSLLDSYPTGDDASGLDTGSYMILYSTGASTNMGPPTGGESRENRDSELGVYHFTLGADRGLVKKISFKREDAPHTEAARISADGPGNLAIRAMYNADVDMVGNGIFVPGQMVFINPGAFSSGGDSGVEGSAANVLGIGGYYLVTKVENFLEGGKFETKLNCIWQSFGERQLRNLERYCRVDENETCPEDAANPNCEESEQEPTSGGVPGGPPGERPSPS